MAKLPEVQQQVLEIALAIPDTENVLVHEALTDIAVSLPASMAIRFVTKAKQWIASLYQLMLPEKLGGLMAHFARGHKGEAALDLARVVLAILADPKTPIRPLTEPRERFDVWHQEQILENHFPALVEAMGGRAQ